MTVIFITKNADSFIFWSNNANNVIQTGPGHRYDNAMNGSIRIRNVTHEDAGSIHLKVGNSQSEQTATASLYLSVRTVRHRSKNDITLFS